MPRELLLMSPYTPPAQHALMLDEDVTSCWLNAWAALWHPAALRQASGPPRWIGPYDQSEPGPEQLVAMPDTPPLSLATDWNDRIREKGGASFRATADRAATIANLKTALAGRGDETGRFDDDRELTRLCFGLGLGYLVVETLFEAMERDRALDRDKFWAEVQAAVQPRADEAIQHLRAAAEHLKAARDTLYSSDIHWLDFGSPGSADGKNPITWIASGRELEAAGVNPLPPRDPDSSDPPLIEICGAPFVERADDLLPLESQLWNLKRGQGVARQIGGEPTVFASRRSAWHAQSPQVLQRAGYSKCVFVPFDDAKLPSHRAAVVQWPAADGKQVEAFCRVPVPADDPQTGFHLGHYLHQTIMTDSTAVIALIRAEKPPANWHDDWLALNELAPVLGKATTIGHFLRDATIGEYASAATADDFSIDHLERVVAATDPRPVSGLARHWRMRRHADAAWTWLALVRSLGGAIPDELAHQVREFEESFETGRDADVAAIERASTAPLVDRLLSRANGNQPGLLLLNPCGFARRVALEHDDFPSAPAIEGPVKAAQRDADGTVRIVAEVPALGFSWIPRSELRSLTLPARKELKLAEGNIVRNELFEAEVDKETGGLRSFRDLKTRENRVGQQIVFQPGSVMRAKSITVKASGPAMGEIVSEGVLLDEHQTVLATFRQHFHAWLGRPLLDLRIEILPERPPQGSPWHSYFGARFAWRDERAMLLRGNAGLGAVTTHTRPITPEYLELRSGRLATLLLPQGLPFHQRHGARMLDMILVPPGETCRSFSIAVALERDHPAQTAWGLISPVVAVPVERGPPHIGPTGWLAHLDSANLMLTSLRPADDGHGVIARLLEVGGTSGSAALRFARNPPSADLLEPDGTTMMPLTIDGDAVQFDYSAHEWLEVRIEW
jgi:hypothetical protein